MDHVTTVRSCVDTEVGESRHPKMDLNIAIVVGTYDGTVTGIQLEQSKVCWHLTQSSRSTV